VLALLGAAAGAPAQTEPPLGLDPSIARQGTTLVVTADESLLAPGGEPARSVTLALARGIRVDTASREGLCSSSQAARSACPESSRIGFGRFNMDVRGYAPTGGETELGWSIDAYLGKRRQRGDTASVVLVSKLLGADLVGALLAPSLGTDVPSTTVTVGRLVRPRSGSYGVELRFDQLPVALDVKAPATATPSRLELSLSAFRRVRENFTRHFRVRTETGGWQVRKVADHRLVGHYLLRTPVSCSGSWASELRVGLPAGEKRTARRISCTNA
jgi:hypothetical protein